MRDIEVDLSGKTFRLLGARDAVSDAIAAALLANGAKPGEGRADLLVVAAPLLPDAAAAVRAPDVASGLAPNGRLVFVLSALAGLPSRRHGDYSATMAAALARMRSLAMQLGPDILVNAVGAGYIAAGAEALAGDPQMLGHTALGRAGRLGDIVNAVLFLCDPANSYTTGQMLNVDGGWSAGYGRNF